MTQNLALQLQKYEQIQEILPTLKLPNIEIGVQDKKQRLEAVLMLVLPYVGNQEHDVLLAQVTAALVIEGFSEAERLQLSGLICAAIEADPERKAQALAVARLVLDLVLARS